MANKLHIKKGDQVKVLSGNSKGKTGEVLSVNPDKRTAVVEDVNVKTKHKKPTAQTPDGGIEKFPAPISVAKLMVIDGNGNATRVGRKLDDHGKLKRYSKKTGEFLD